MKSCLPINFMANVPTSAIFDTHPSFTRSCLHHHMFSPVFTLNAQFLIMFPSLSHHVPVTFPSCSHHFPWVSHQVPIIFSSCSHVPFIFLLRKTAETTAKAPSGAKLKLMAPCAWLRTSITSGEWRPRGWHCGWKKSCTSWQLLVTMKRCKEWDCSGIIYLPAGAGLLPSTV